MKDSRNRTWSREREDGVQVRGVKIVEAIRERCGIAGRVGDSEAAPTSSQRISELPWYGADVL